MKNRLALPILTGLVAIATMAVPAAGTVDCPATFTAPHAGTYYIQAGDGVMLATLDTGEPTTFWQAAPGGSWAAWTAIVDADADPTLDVVFRASPGVLVADGVFNCPTGDEPTVPAADAAVTDVAAPGVTLPVKGTPAGVMPL